ncbi:MAG: hypothetical protein LBU34_11000 [Planctomycetaceae bacterium]|nr:hypothetical protein [Planctomycetaceae bacterium]
MTHSIPQDHATQIFIKKAAPLNMIAVIFNGCRYFVLREYGLGIRTD